ncbi:MAG: cytochrome c-type biogenesis protein CcmH [Gemmatimonadales bacterium]
MKPAPDLSRREVLKYALGAAPLSLGIQERQPAAPLQAPELAGPSRERTTDWDNDPYIIGIEVQLRCMCGCNQSIYQCRTTDFTCPLWPTTHPQIISMVESGKSAQEVIDAFVAENGEEVLMAPRAEGFNVMGYVLPGALIATVGAALAWVLARRGEVTPVAVATDREGEPTELDEELIRKELDKLDY